MSARSSVRRRNAAHAPPAISPEMVHASFKTPVSPPSGTATPRTPRSTLGSPLSGHAVRLRRRSLAGDLDAHPRMRNSLSEVELLPWFCCMTPALSMFFLYGSILVTALCFEATFYLIVAGLTLAVFGWIANLAVCSLLGAYKLRDGTSKDWQAQLEQIQHENSANNEFLHIVLLPNYKENEAMLKDTLDNLGRSPLAASRVRIVLAMEAREGQAGRDKAKRLIEEKASLFVDIFATFHPENMEGEVAGKSSNTQWAYREAVRHYAPILLGCDPTRVLITVGDADTLWHPQYLSALTYQALMLPTEQRAWRIWQPPMLLLRNVFSVPAMTRASAHGTLIFELSGLASQALFPALAYSSYSLSLALASHPEVDGWDVDVIAEDHHMFCKCYFAALWELAHAASSVSKIKERSHTNPVVPRLKIEPIFLPAVSFLVESSEGYFQSLWARFQQARRHSQGVVELGYVLLQYMRLTGHTGYFQLPLRAHVGILSIAFKMHTLHITTTAQCFALVLAFFLKVIPTSVQWFVAGGLGTLLQHGIQFLSSQFQSGWSAMSLAQQVLATLLQTFSSVVVVYSFTSFVVVLDLIEGRYYREVGRASPARAILSVAEEGDEGNPGSGCDDPDSQDGDKNPGREQKPYIETIDIVRGPQTLLQKTILFVSLFLDTALMGYPTIMFYAVIPVLLAGYSLVRRGTDFEYIVAEKPE